MWFVLLVILALAFYCVTSPFASLLLLWLLPLLDKAPLGCLGYYLEHWCQFDTPTTFTVSTFVFNLRSGNQTATRSQFRGLHIRLCIVYLSFVLISLYGHTTFCAIRGEGCAITMDGMGADRNFEHQHSYDSAKFHGPGPKKIYESPQTSMTRKVCKRSYKRAVHRAAQHGVTWYRGKLYTATQLGTTVKPLCNQSEDQECSTVQANTETAFYLFFMELQWSPTITLGLSDDVAGESRNRHFIFSGNTLAIHT